MAGDTPTVCLGETHVGAFEDPAEPYAAALPIEADRSRRTTSHSKT